MAHHLFMILERLAGNGQSLSQHKGGFAQGEGVAFKGCGTMGPQVAELGEQCPAQIRVEGVEKGEHQFNPKITVFLKE
jgi:hypothetical protein